VGPISRIFVERRKRRGRLSGVVQRVESCGMCGQFTPERPKLTGRYTVHDKAQNYAVPIPLANGWTDDQMDELFSSLLGGASMKGAGAEVAVTAATGMSNGDDGLSGLGGLRVF